MITSEDAAFFYKDQGYLLVKGVFNRQEVEEMRNAVEKKSFSARPGQRWTTIIPGRATTFLRKK